MHEQRLFSVILICPIQLIISPKKVILLKWGQGLQVEFPVLYLVYLMVCSCVPCVRCRGLFYSCCTHLLCNVGSCVIAWKFTGCKSWKRGSCFPLFFTVFQELLHLYFISSSSWKRSTLCFVQTSIKRQKTSQCSSMLITLMEKYSILKNTHNF